MDNGLSPEARAEVEKTIGYHFRDAGLLDRALMHASAVDERLLSNERLEFLGDAVLGMVACERIFTKYPDLLEGEMTKIKSAVVSRRACAKLAREANLAAQLVIGKGMRTSADIPQSLYAAVLEAVVGAVYLDGGFDAARALLTPWIDPLIERASRSGHQHNYKSVLQQHAQRVFGTSPMYRVLDEQGPDHAKCFQICVEIGGRAFEPAWGQSKKQTEQQAALNALRGLNVVTDDGEVELVETVVQDVAAK
ncbi:MAG: ribonuclease III [Phycisphaerales bacterium]|jgi:ribonuclease-3|nr:ribonuclease III [Phycisphaerales bacterium]